MAQTDLQITAAEEVVTEKGQEDDTMSYSLYSWRKTSEVEIEEEMSRNRRRPMHAVKRLMGMTSWHYILPSTRTANAGGGDPTSYWEAMNSVLEDWVMTM
jgi:hypothetical protein